MRAYTNWNRNYGPNHYFTKSLRILTPFQRVLDNEAIVSPSLDRVKILADKTQYGPREKVTLTIQTRNERNLPVQANLSVAVLDQNQVIPVKESMPIQEALELEKIPESMGLDRFSYEIEKSLRQKGKLLDEKEKPISGQVVIFINDFEGMVEMEADRDGEFVMEEMEFYGKMDLAVQALDKKGRPASKIELLNPLKAPVVLPAEAYFPEVEKVSESIFLKSKEAEFQELDSVLVMEKGLPKTPKALYGTPSYVVSGEKLMATGNTTDIVNSLAGNVPGMRVTVEGSSGRQQIRIRSGATSVSGSMEPIVMLNGNIMVSSGSTTAADNLKSINPFDVDRIEIVSRTVSMLGDLGRNGVIAVYLKNFDPDSPSAGPKKSTGFQEFTIEGYQPSTAFFQMDYAQEEDRSLKDLRQTLYWNPYLVTDDSGNLTLSFYTNETGGPMTIQVRGLGLDGLPVSGTQTINIK